MRIIDLEQGSKEWLDFKMTRLGGSEAAICLGISPFKSALELWEEKLGLRPPQLMNRAMERGIALEEEARREYERITGRIMSPCVVLHPDIDWCLASLDGMSICGRHIVELKVPGQGTHMMAARGELPPHYRCQIQHQIFVTGLQEADYFSYDGETSYLIRVERDNEFIERMLEAEIAFIACLVNRIPPRMTDKEQRKQEEQDLSQDNDWLNLEQTYLYFKERMDEAEIGVKHMKEKMQEYCKNLDVKGSRLKMSKVVTTGRVNYSNLCADLGISDDMTEKYRGPAIESYRITIEKE